MSRVASRILTVAMATLLATGYLTARPGPVQAAGSVALTTAGVAYTQDFNTLAISGTANTTLPNGWDLAESGTSSRNNAAYAASTGSDNAGDVYSFGSATDTERAFGTLFSGTLSPTIGASFTNNTGFAIAELSIAYTGEQWRSGVLSRGAADRLNFQLSSNATSLTSGTWVDYDSLDLNSPNTSAATNTLDGNLASNRASVAFTIPGLSIPNGSTFWIRWTDSDISPGADDGLGVDDFSLTPTVDDSIILGINDVSQNEGTSGTAAMNFTVSLSNPAGPGGVTFDIATGDGTATTADLDYIGAALTGQTIPEGGSSYEFTVGVNGDTAVEPDESFFVNVSNVSGVDAVVDDQGLGTILTDDINPCTQAFTPIYSIQGSGLSAAITGNVTTQGVVVADIEGTAAGQGFYLQDPTGDGMAATSDGLFVFTGSGNAVSAGDVVRVTGFARERFNQTALNGTNSNSSPVTDIINCGAGTVAATDVTMPFASGTFLEQYEGMLIRFPQQLVIAEYFNYDRFGEVVLALPLDGEDRPFTGTAIDEPGAAANARTAANLLRRITLDDNQSTQNPPVLRHPNGAAFSLANLFRGGDKVQNAVGALGFDFGLYRIFPTAPADFDAVNARPLAPTPVGGRLKVSAMNTLNFFITADYPSGNALDNDCGPANNVECRGWDFGADPLTDPIVDDEFQRQRDKLLQALVGLDADVLGLNEIENSTGVDPLAGPNGIVDGINGILGTGTYSAISTGTIGTDAIKVGLMYKPAMVTPVGSHQVLTSAVDPRFDDLRSRPALAQTFVENATGERFTVVVNHLKSKGDSGLLAPCTDSNPDNDVPDCDQLDGQGFWNFARTQAAEALVDWLATDPTGSGDPDFFIMGDLNSYAREDPITAIKAGPDDAAGTADDYTNLIAQYQGTHAYSFVFDGQAGYLDHALANSSAAGQVTGATEWHINADEPDILDYDVSFKPEAQDRLFELNQFRTSDHDPVQVGLALNAPPTFDFVAGGTCSTSANGGSFLVDVADLQTPAGSLSLSLIGNTNTTLVPNANVSISGGATRTIAITAASGQSGNGVLTFSLGDGVNTVTFQINVQIGTAAIDVLTGTAGSDLIVGYRGADQLSGLAGADVLCGGQGGDALSGGDGADTLEGGRGSDSLSGGEGNDVLRGGRGDDSLFGDGGDDTLTGNAGADAFSGGTGTDTNTDLTPSQGDTWDGT